MEQQNNKPEKLTDKAFSRLILTSVVAILFFIICLCSTTYAWFEQSVPNENNEIKAAERCDLKVTLANSSETILEADCTAIAVLNDLAPGTYTVTMTLPKDSASGYLVIATSPVQSYYTDYIANHTDEVPHTLTFTLVVEGAAPLDITFTPRWGIYSGTSDVGNEGTLTIGQVAP